VVVFDLDEDEFVDFGAQISAGDFNSVPEAYRSAIVHQVDAAKKREKSGSIKQGKMLARPFLAFFVQMFWNFKGFLTVEEGFDKAGFINSKSSSASRSFMEEFVETQMVCQFFQDYGKKECQYPGRYAAFESLTNFVDEQFKTAIRELENANPRERFKRRMSKILPFGQAMNARRGPSMQNVLEPVNTVQFSKEQNHNIEIVKKSDQVSSFGMPLSTMSKKSGMFHTPKTERTNAAVENIGSPMSPFTIRGKVDPSHSPCIFSPAPETDNDDSVEDKRVVHNVLHLERYLSHFFEVSAIDVADDTSFASAEDTITSPEPVANTEAEGTLQEDMVELAKLIQESWTDFGDDVQPIITSPSSPYHQKVYDENQESMCVIDLSEGDETIMGTLPMRLFDRSVDSPMKL
jgi:hypothetical protein